MLCLNFVGISSEYAGKGVKLPAGKYFIGDPSYVISDGEKWKLFLESSDFFEGSIEAAIGDEKFWAADTAYGNGCYFSKDGGRFFSDSGLMGIVPFALVEKYSKLSAEKLEIVGKIVEFDEEFEVSFGRGNIFGPTHIFGENEIFANDFAEVSSGDDDEL